MIAVVRYGDITAVNIKKKYFYCDVMPCSVAYIQTFRKTTFCLHIHGKWLKNKLYVIYGIDGRWNGEKRREKTTKEFLEGQL